MSDLQVSLLIIGAIVVGGVTAFNWFQQWRLRRRLEDAFGDKPDDVLLREEARRGPASRGEPPLHSAGVPGYEPDPVSEQPLVAPPPANAARSEVVSTLPDVPGFDSAIDYIT